MLAGGRKSGLRICGAVDQEKDIEPGSPTGRAGDSDLAAMGEDDAVHHRQT